MFSHFQFFHFFDFFWILKIFSLSNERFSERFVFFADLWLGTGPAPGSPRHLEAVSPRVDDVDYAQRKPSTTNEFRKWGYNTDAINRAESIGYDANAIQYSFGHADNHDNQANRPYSWDATGTNNQPEDFKGYKDDWRYSLRMGGCLYETTNWTYDAS